MTLAGDARTLTDISVDLAPQRPGRLLVRTPFLAAAGCLGYGVEGEGQVPLDRFGAIVTRGVTLAPRSGSPPPRMAEVPSGLLHAIGLPGPGIEAVLERYAPRWLAWSVPVILSLCAAEAVDFGSLAQRADGVPGVAALELDLASPDLARGGRPLSLDPTLAADATAAARAATELPILVKLSPAATDLRALARALVEAGADALTCTGAMPALAMDPRGGGPLLGSAAAALSGPALRPISLRVVSEVRRAVSEPIVGCGGVSGLPDALEYLAAGADAVAIGTAALADPALPARLGDELAAHGPVARPGVTDRRRQPRTPHAARPR